METGPSDGGHLQAVINADDQPVFALDRDLRYTAFNRAHADVVRALHDTAIALGERMLGHESIAADQETAVHNLQRALAGERVVGSACVGEGVDRIFLDVAYSPLRDDDGSVVGVVVRAHDVTQRRLPEARLVESRALLQSLVEETTDAVYVKDLEGRYLLFNPAAERITGRPAAEVLGRDDRLLFTAEEAAVVMEGDRRVLEAGRLATYEERVTDADGRSATFLSTKGPVHGESGELLGIFGIARDITARKQAEERMRAHEAQLDAILDATADGVLAVDVERRVVKANRRFAEMWRIPDELVEAGDEMAMLRYAADQLADPEQFVAQVGSLMRSSETVSDVLTFSDGRVFERHSAPIMVASEVTGRVWSFSDVTAAESAKAALEARERTLSALLANLPGMAYRCANDREWTMEFVSDGCMELTGYPPEDLVGNVVIAFGDLVHADDAPALWQDIQAAIARGEAWTVTYRILDAEGDVRWVWERGLAFTEGERVVLEGFIQDVTDRHEAEEGLRDREARLRARTQELDALLSVGRAVAASIDYDEVIAHAARAAGEALGAPRCDVWEYVPGDELLVCRHLWERDPLPGLAARVAGATYDLRQHDGAADALLRGEALLDQRSDPGLSVRDREEMDAWGEKTWLTVPLFSKRGLLGVMTLSEMGDERDFTDGERRLAVAIAEQAAVALENALLVREQETHTRRLSALVAAGRETASRLEMETLLVEIARHAAESVSVPLAYIYEYEPARGLLITRSRFGPGEAGRSEPLGLEFDLSEAPSDLAILANDEVVVETLSDPELSQAVRDLMEEWGEKTLVNVPFRFRGEPLGMLVLIETREERVFTADDLDYLRAFGQQAAVAFHNASLYREAERARQELAALNADLERRVEQRTAELRGVNQELEAFAYSVSHDLRAPLRAIDGFSEILREDEGDALSDAGRGHLARVRTSAQRMGELIDALLSLSRLGRREIRISSVDLTAMATRELQRLAEQEPTRRVRWEVQPGCVVRSDGELLEAVLANLIGNAWKFTRQAAEAHIEFGGRALDGEVEFFVRDDGAGFEPAYADKLFQPFQRLHSDVEFPGTGIGLATVRRVVTRLGGRCRAEGAPGAGATFSFTLPTQPRET